MVHFYFYTQSYIYLIFRNNLTRTIRTRLPYYLAITDADVYKELNGPRASASSYPEVLYLYFLLGPVPVERLAKVAVLYRFDTMSLPLNQSWVHDENR